MPRVARLIRWPQKVMDIARFKTDPAAADVVAKLENQLWRKARDAAKELCKRDRKTYLDLLIEANAGLAREMTQKGLVKDAETVINHLANFAPPELIRSLRQDLTAPAAAKASPAEGATAAAACWETVLQAHRLLESDPDATICAAGNAAVDLLATDTFSPVVSEDDPCATRLAAELAAVRAACAATGEGHWDIARDTLRALPRRSVFRHWRMFLRGARCVFEVDFKTARQCFADLPTTGALARAARSLAPDLAAGGPAAPPAARVALDLASTGHPAAWAKPLLDANTALKQRDRLKAFATLAHGLKGRFPSTDVDFPAMLTDLIVPFHSSMNADDSDQADFMMDKLLERGGGTQQQRAELHLAASRAMCVAEASSMPPLTLKRYWETVIDHFNERHGRDVFRDSLARQWLGQTLLDHLEQDAARAFGGPGDPALVRAAKASLEAAAKLDPANESACVSLVRLLDLQGDTKARILLLESLVKRFPANKEFLVQSGKLASERKAYGKALSAFRPALAIDPLDKSIKTEMACVLIRLAKDRRTKNRPAEDLWDELDRIAEDRPGLDHLQITRWLIRLRKSLFETDPQASAQAREDARRTSPSAIEFASAEHSLALVYQLEERTWSRTDWSRTLQQNTPTWAILIALIEHACHFTRIQGWNEKMTRSVSPRITEVLKILMRDSLDLEPEGPLDLLDFLSARSRHDLSSYGHRILNDCRREFAQSLKSPTAVARQATDSSLRLARLIDDSIAFHSRDRAETIAMLDSIIAEAEAFQRHKTAARAKMMREKLEQSTNRRQPAPSESDHADWGASFVDPFHIGDDDEDEEFDADFPSDDEMLDANALESFLGAVSSGDPSAVQILKDALIAAGAPAGEIDALVADATGQRKPKPSPAKKRGKKRRRK